MNNTYEFLKNQSSRDVALLFIFAQCKYTFNETSFYIAGYGDMAVSNSIGSNVFDILIGLGLPWFIQTVIIETNDVVRINSAALTFSAISLLATVVFLLATVIINRWRLTKLVGVICLIVYVIFLVFACLYELNVFGDLNPPPCAREE